MEAYYAHSGKALDRSDWQLLRVHLLAVAQRAYDFALAATGDEEFARAAWWVGLLHDLGKYRLEFQKYLLGKRFRGEQTRHKQDGAAVAMRSGRPDLSFAIAGHHGGLHDFAKLKSLVSADNPLLAQLDSEVLPAALADCPELREALQMSRPLLPKDKADLHVRLLFSCLVDADWLDTAGHEEKPLPLEAAALLPSVLKYIGKRAAECAEPAIRDLRAEILAAARTTPPADSGSIFTMTVPTGGGKTLASLVFALEQARRHNLRRIIYVAPFLSILEQNARVWRQALGAEKLSGLILEHHSLAEPADDGDDEYAEQRLRLAENWDAPFVLTTNVQFFESLFSNRPGQCRKLHNIARSLVILDECQALPKDFTAPTVAVLEQMTQQWGCQFLLCTATQPAWNYDSYRLPTGFRKTTTIVPASLNLHERLRRVRVQWPDPDAPPQTWEQIAAMMMESPQALCVVNSKRAARDLFLELRKKAPESAFHLSTSMCPAHRLQVLDEIRRRLKEGEPCHVVSTQLVEAGVDIDFPLLLRELGPLDSIVQAIGRCNREGRLGREGRVIIFIAGDETMPLDNWYQAGRDIVKQMLRAGKTIDLCSPMDLARYYNQLLPTGNTDAKHILDLRSQFQFASIADAYQLIENGGATSVIITGWEKERKAIQALLKELRDKPSRSVYRRLSRYSVNIFADDRFKIACTLDAASYPGLELCDAIYHEHLGLVLDKALTPPI